MARDLDLSADIIDTRDIIERIEELRAYLETVHEEQGFMSEFREWLENMRKDSGPLVSAMGSGGADVATDIEELAKLESLMEELAGNGGDEQWEGVWYPITLIRDSYFTDYARELLQDCGDLPKEIPHYIEIDWEATARNIRVDYSSVEIEGETYWYR